MLSNTVLFVSSNINMYFFTGFWLQSFTDKLIPVFDLDYDFEFAITEN